MKERLVDQFEYTSVIPLVFTCHSILVLSGQSLVGNIYDEVLSFSESGLLFGTFTIGSCTPFT